MKVKDLRIGNFINDRGLSIRINPSIMVNILQGLYLDCYKPIPLTEQIFMKFGLSKSAITDGKFYFENHLEFTIEDNYWVEPSLNVLIDGKYITCIEFVHDLQNIVYYLTGKEL